MDDPSWIDEIGLGAAGNFTSHLEQASETNNFKGLDIENARATQGDFPFDMPAASRLKEAHFLKCYSISTSQVRLGPADEDHPIEPEIARRCDHESEGEPLVRILLGEAMVALNDCSIRRFAQSDDGTTASDLSMLRQEVI